MNSESALLSVRGLVKSDGLQPLLKGVTFEVRGGEVVAVSGAKGSGASVLLQIIAGSLRPDSGQVLLDGTDITAMSADAKARLGLRSPLQPLPVWTRLARALREPTVGERVEAAAARAMGGLSRQERRQMAARMLEQTHLSQSMHMPSSQLSLGQRERVTVTELLVGRPRVIVLDEPFKPTDAVTLDSTLQLIRDMASMAGVAVLLSDRSGASARCSDRVLHLRDGQLTQHETALPPATSAVDPDLVFISYSRSDAEIAAMASARLKEAGVRTWLDRNDIRPGENWDMAVEAGLRRSGQVVVLLSAASSQSDNVLNEISYALNAGKRVFPVMVRPCDAPLLIARIQYVDAQKNFDAAMAELAKAIKARVPV